MPEQLSDDELELLREHRAKKARAAGRKVRVKGRHDDSGAEYEFDLDGDEAERVISRHSGLWAEDEPEEDAGGTGSSGKRAQRRGAGDAGGDNNGGEAVRRSYFAGKKD